MPKRRVENSRVHFWTFSPVLVKIALKSSLEYFQDTGSLQLAYVDGKPNKEVMLFNIKERVRNLSIDFIIKLLG